MNNQSVGQRPMCKTCARKEAVEEFTLLGGKAFCSRACMNDWVLGW